MNLWLLHGIFAFLAWGLLAPVGTIISTSRVILFRQTSPLWDHRDNPDELQGRTWVKFHRYINESVILCTWILFSLAAFGVPKGHHFRNAHQIVGLIIFILTFPIWALGRLLMPPKVARNDNSAIEAMTEHIRLIPQGHDNDETGQKMIASSGTTDRQVYFLVWAHRVNGVVALFAGLWEIYSGISMYSKLSASGDDLIVCYYYWCGFLILLLTILIVLDLIMRGRRVE
jgi:hypothetical protein